MNQSKVNHLKVNHSKKQHRNFKRAVDIVPLEVTSLEDVNQSQDFPITDPHYQSELEYDGYQSIEDYDNHIYHLDIDRKEDPEEELIFEDREESEDTGEEDPIDPQGNREQERNREQENRD